MQITWQNEQYVPHGAGAVRVEDGRKVVLLLQCASHDVLPFSHGQVPGTNSRTERFGTAVLFAVKFINRSLDEVLGSRAVVNQKEHARQAFRQIEAALADWDDEGAAADHWLEWVLKVFQSFGVQCDGGGWACYFIKQWLSHSHWHWRCGNWEIVGSGPGLHCIIDLLSMSRRYSIY